PLGARQMKELRNQGADRAAGHDDRTLGAERATRTNRDRRRERFQNRDSWLDAAAVDENRLNRFGDAVAPDALRPVSGHQPDDERTRNRRNQDEPAQVVAGRRHEGRADALEEEQVGEQTDQTQEREG